MVDKKSTKMANYTKDIFLANYRPGQAIWQFRLWKISMFCLLFESFLEKGFVNCKPNSEFRLRSRVALVAQNSLLGFCEHKIQLTATVKWPAQVCTLLHLVYYTLKMPILTTKNLMIQQFLIQFIKIFLNSTQHAIVAQTKM